MELVQAALERGVFGPLTLAETKAAERLARNAKRFERRFGIAVRLSPYLRSMMGID